VESHARSFEAASSLAWLAAAGADVIVDDGPRNWLATPQPAPQPRPIPLPQRPQPAGAAAPSGQARPPAAALADAAADLPALEAALAGFNHPLRTARPAQLLTGTPQSGLLILIDQPLAADDAAASLLEKMLAAIGLGPANCAIGHLLPWPTPAGRAPRDDEIAGFAPFIARAMALAAPRIVLALGDRAANHGSAAGVETRRGIASLRGKWRAIDTVPMIATFHPRQLLAQPELKRLAWADLQAFAQKAAA
jgi:DNA polymerase